MSDEADDYAKAFGQGSDARITGQPKESNPFDFRANMRMYRAWLYGWHHVDREWGRDSIGRRIMSLPPIQGSVNLVG